MLDLEKRLKFVQKLREFFISEGFIEIDTPPLVENPGMEPHIHPFKVHDKFLHTSPEFRMKEVLAQTKLQNIFSLSYCFRKEPKSPIHREQFLMLEWYRRDQLLDKIIEDTQSLLSFLSNNKCELVIKTMSEVFQEFLNFCILDFLTKDQLLEKIKKDFKDIPIGSVELEWDDYFFLLFLNKIEPLLKKYPFLIITNFPSPLSALSEIDKNDSRVAKRFELYIHGVEIANCFQELRDVEEQIIRFKEFEDLKEQNYKYKLPWPSRFLKNLENLPVSSGIALGADRLYGALKQTDYIFWD